MLDKIEELFAAGNAETFENILYHLADKIDALPRSRWHPRGYFEFRIEFWKEHLPAWMNWKYVHGHPLEVRWLAYDMKNTFCYAVRSSDLPGPAYEHKVLSDLISDSFKQHAPVLSAVAAS